MPGIKRKRSEGGGAIFIIIIFIFTLLIGYCKRKINEKENFLSVKNYKIKFSKDFKKGLVTQDDLGISIVIAVDCSGSMKDWAANAKPDEPEKYKVASQSLNEVISFLEDFYNKEMKKNNIKLKLAILKFNSDVNVVFDLQEVNDSIFKSIKEITSNPYNFYPSGRTAIGATLEKGTEILMQSGTIFKSLILITDGQNTEGVAPEAVLKAIVNNNNNLSTPDFPVLTNTILVTFVGFDLEENVFSRLKDFGARVVSASNSEELKDVLKNIFITDISKFENK
ncbi:MAG TPA: vWA domain-containing protein [Spirochaetota bacterium]|nr:vWA domain-containing protein [Spirochaetota bacterium]HOL57681.1 vWA domain-containing protein [Spirochaetota bacterium]HPP04549.1 vWA domain-containing protein [Spirochaetota bacterium]